MTAQATMGDMLNHLCAINTQMDARTFLEVSRAAQGEHLDENLAFLFARHLPEFVGHDESDRIELMVRRAGWTGSPFSFFDTTHA